MKKTWQTACFEPGSDQDQILRSERSPSELAGPGPFSFNIHIKDKKNLSGFFEYSRKVYQGSQKLLQLEYH